MANYISQDAGVLFGGKKTGKTIMAFDAPSAYTPQADPLFTFPEWAQEALLWAGRMTDPLMIYGPSGAGKTSCIKQIAALLNYPVYEITGTAHFEFARLLGHHTIKDGNMAWVDGPLPMAMGSTGEPGILLINESDIIPPDELTGLNTVLDGSPLCIDDDGGRLVQAHPAFRLVCTANTNGSGDTNGTYVGTQRMNMAFIDRFFCLEAAYLPEAKEIELVKRAVPSLPAVAATQLVQYANGVRRMFNMEYEDGVEGQISITMTTRTVLRTARLIDMYTPLAKTGVNTMTKALEGSLWRKAAPMERNTLEELAQHIFSKGSK